MRDQYKTESERDRIRRERALKQKSPCVPWRRGMKNDGSFRRLVKDRLLHKLRDKQLLLRGNKDTHPFKSSRALGLAVLVRGTGKEDAGWSSVPSSTAIHHVRGMSSLLLGHAG